ncbi:MAG: hypothetical protein GKR89_12255 [Candidatus Latescibacteria bacterium]|nr:hypothetical protein [Candidatus Latescibacterota bacterium]
MADSHGAPENPGYETRDAEVGPLRNFGIFLIILCVFAFVSMWALFNTMEYYLNYFDDPAPPLAQTRTQLQGPRLQIDPPQQKIELEALEVERLTTYTWVDSSTKLARIPIARAKELLSDGTFTLATAVQTAPAAE